MLYDAFYDAYYAHYDALIQHGSSEGHEMLKRNDKYHSIADDVPILKM